MVGVHLDCLTEQWQTAALARCRRCRRSGTLGDELGYGDDRQEVGITRARSRRQGAVRFGRNRRWELVGAEGARGGIEGGLRRACAGC